ncbi:SAM-dependent methyltransferase [Aliidiomarina minuta]|uniref:SAM-dependent methyltransferase n=1 Tax=Aliidiomarina minuta TaxID=880057 RepID=A0A432W7L2_9GAMM|nr:class I SAM-dependent methyltransferase [Aliidiomarina minuta]RUO25991.1 SAM-dependent methyltransferase [Aliidiomarina minuta]
MPLNLKLQALADIGRYLQGDTYQFVTVTPQTHEYYLQRHSQRMAKGLRDVFGWCLPFHKTLLSDELWQLMEKAEVLEPCAEGWRSRVRWSTLDGSLFVHSAYPTDKNDAVFFGPDTYRFARAIEQHLQGESDDIRSAIDIGCGSGAGAAYLGKRLPEAAVTAVDINPLSIDYTQVNADIASTGNVTAYQSNLLDSVDGAFDLMVANPPYMHDPEARVYRHGGGLRGAGLSLQIVDTALQRLAAGGALVLYTGVAIVDGEDLFLQELKRRTEGRHCRWGYQEVDPDVFGEELLKTDYEDVERIAAVVLTLRQLG